MRSEYGIPSKGKGMLRVCRWTPEKPLIGVFQIVHGIGEHVERYQAFAEFLNGLGYLVVAEDHMGHGKSVNGGGIRGYFHGGWFTAAEDSFSLLAKTKEEFPELPYVLFGHSMGSFLVRTILCKHPDSGIAATILCGTGWQREAVLSTGIAACRLACRLKGETEPNQILENLVFANYNRRVEHPRTPSDWLTRDSKIVDEFLSDPLCGATPTAGLMRDLLTGIQYIQKSSSLEDMQKTLPVLFISGGDDPVGNYGRGVRQAVDAFRKTGMEDVSCKIYPLGRHEILNEINKEEVYQDIAHWLEKKLVKQA